jgi:D-3-phosphoglycerate dehydrogenase
VHSPAALLDAIRSGQIHRAAVDVYPREPAPGSDRWSNPYADEERVICTPHIGAATQEAQPRIARRVATTIEGYSRRGLLRDCVFAPRFTLGVPNIPKGSAVLAVVHSVSRGIKKAIDDAIFEAGASNLGSAHRDFDVGIAYDLAVIDRPMTRQALEELVARAQDLAKDPRAIRSVRQLIIDG